MKTLAELQAEYEKGQLEFVEGKGSAEDISMKQLLGRRRELKEKIKAGEVDHVIPRAHPTDPIHNNINALYGSMNSGLNISNMVEHMDPAKLIQGDDRVLVLVPHGTPEELNRHSLMFWDLENIIKATHRRDNPDAVINAKFVLMDPTYTEFRKQCGVIQQEIEKSDVVLHLKDGAWHVEKLRSVELKDEISYIIGYPPVTVDELLAGKSEEVWIYIDHRLLETNECENIYHVFASEVAERFPDIILKVMSGHPSQEWKEEHGIVLKATAKGFFVEQAPGTDHAWKFIPRVRFGADGKIVSELTQKELTRMSLSRFGFVLVDPDTGLTLSKEEQDKHARGIVASVRSRKK